MLGSRVATIRDLLALAEPGWSPPSRSGGAPVPAEGSLFAAGHVPRRRPRPRRPVLQKRKRTGAPSSTAAGGVPSCNPETSVGLMAAVAEPASSASPNPHAPARPASWQHWPRTSTVTARAATPPPTAAAGGRRRVPPRVNGSLLACKLCRRRLDDDRTIYIYMDNTSRRKLAAEALASKRAWRRHDDLHHDGKSRVYYLQNRSLF